MFKSEEYMPLLESKDAKRRIVGEYWYTKRRYKNLLKHIEGCDSVDYNTRQNIDHLALRLNDIRVICAVEGIKLNSVNSESQDKKEFEGGVGQFEVMDNICQKFFYSVIGDKK